MLNRHDRERLAAIESALAESDPGFVDEINRLSGRFPWFTPAVHGVVWGVLTAMGVLTVFCLLGGMWLSAAVLGTLAASAAILLRTEILLPPRRTWGPPESEQLW